jgi:hypothetical protein
LPAQPAASDSKLGSNADADAGAHSDPAANDVHRLFADLQGRHIPESWLNGIARLDSNQAPADIPFPRWRQFVNDCHIFVRSPENWAERAAELGWDTYALFGRRTRPLDLGSAGLVWAIGGGKLVELRRDWATIEPAGDRSQHVHHRRKLKAADVALPWIGLRRRSV